MALRSRSLLRSIGAVLTALLALARPALAAEPVSAREAEGLSPPSTTAAQADRDLPELLGGLIGLAPQPDAEPKRFHWALLPYVLANPLLGAGGGLAAVGGFRLGPPETAFSHFEASAFATTNHQQGYLLRSEVRLPRNAWILSGDWGAGRFPNPAFGLGGDTRPSDRTVVHRRQVQVHETIYRQLVSHLYGGVGYLVDDFFDIVDDRRAAGEATRFSVYLFGTSGRSLLSGMTLSLLWDGRDSTVEPTRGSYLLVRLRLEPALMGSDEDWRSIYLDGRTYLPIPGRRDVLAFWAFAWSSYGQTPYLLLPQVGADPEHRSGRGLVEGRFAAKDLLYGEVEYRAHVWKALGAVLAVNLTLPSQRGAGEEGLAFRSAYASLATGLRVLLDRSSGANLVLDLAWAPGEGSGFYLNANETF